MVGYTGYIWYLQYYLHVFFAGSFSKNRVLNIQDGLPSQFSILKQDKKFVDKLMIRSKISFSILQLPNPFSLPSCGQTGQAHVLAFSPFSALCSFREQHQALPGEVVWRQPSQGSVRSMQSCIDRPGRWQKQLRSEILLLVVSFLFSYLGVNKSELKVSSKVATSLG